MKISKVLLVVVALQRSSNGRLRGAAAPGKPMRAHCQYKDMVMCYPQLGAESDWRTATRLHSRILLRSWVQVDISDAQQKQENQISLYGCIQQK